MCDKFNAEKKQTHTQTQFDAHTSSPISISRELFYTIFLHPATYAIIQRGNEKNLHKTQITDGE